MIPENKNLKYNFLREGRGELEIEKTFLPPPPLNFPVKGNWCVINILNIINKIKRIFIQIEYFIFTLKFKIKITNYIYSSSHAF